MFIMKIKKYLIGPAEQLWNICGPRRPGLIIRDRDGSFGLVDDL